MALLVHDLIWQNCYHVAVAMDINIFVIALWVTAVLAIIVAIYAIRHRDEGEWTLPFMLLALAIGWWSFWYGMEIASPDLAAKTLWAKLEYIGIAITPVAWFLFAIQYTGRTTWWTRNKQLALFIIPFITIVLVFTNELHQLNWASVDIDTTGQFPVMDVSYGAWFWFHSAYSYFFLLAGAVVIVQGYFRFPPAYRRQQATLLIGVLVPLAANAIYLSGMSPFPNLDLSPFGLVLSTILIGISIFGLGLFNIVPVARRVVVDNMKEGVVVLDLHYKIVDINPAAEAVFQQTNLIGQSVIDLLQNRPDIVEAFLNVDEAEAELEGNVNGAIRYFELQISPLHDKRSRLNGRLAIFRDVTERKAIQTDLAQARDDALEAMRVKTELLARVSHELRTPLNVILGYAEMLQEGLYGELNEGQWDAAEKMIESTAFLTKQVNELLDISRLEMGQLELSYEWFNISKLVERTYTQMKVLAEVRHLQLEYQIDASMPEKIYNDPGRIEQILLNLLGNAIKFSDEGKILIYLSRIDETYWMLKVQDEGTGIPQSAQTLVFEPFRRVDRSLMRTQVGTGLGLAIVKQLATLMQGDVTLESEVGEGSTFTVILPFVQEAKSVD